jgi:hypothetical protein
MPSLERMSVVDSRAVEAIVASGKAEKLQRSCSATVESVKLIRKKWWWR